MTQVYRSSAGAAVTLSAAEETAFQAQLDAFARLDLAAAKALRVAQINAEWSARTVAGVMLGGSLIQTDERSQTQIRGVVEFLTANPLATRKIVTRTGERIDVDLATATAMRSAVEAYVLACAEREADLVDAVNDAAVSTVAAVRAIDIKAGWP
ncbi:MAG: DUF4376 domain-containing protein [Pseudomonadota bacterium]